ncbi:MAG TPA: N-acetyl-gamma-glutamyl-phosphate reductase, partial [Magnetospirillaceae bacterium]|nr:N-acetyl-gamma-glutamyl-phosphate reductase [Magnetospirillaceae bacterium]
LLEPMLAVERSEVVFSALPHGHAEALAERCVREGRLLVDLSADFRFGADETTYRSAYGLSWKRPDLHAEAVYGLPELNRARIAEARIIGNPGCYPTSAALGLFPAIRLGIAERQGIVIDATSGVTGAGREPTRATHFPEVADSITPYKIGEHRHAPEIEAVLAAMAGGPVECVFTPHLAPFPRGILSTIYFPLARRLSAPDLREHWAAFYASERFVRVLPAGSVAGCRSVRQSNYCDISVHLARGGRTAIVVSVIDNMVKGAAGQAVQNMNIALGLAEDAGLRALPAAF